MTLLSTENLISLVTLALMEIVLGIDNIVFIAILSQKVPPQDRSKLRRLGLVLALFMRLGLLATLSFIMKLTAPLFTIAGQGISGRDLVLLLGGIFLVGKSTHEIYDKMEGEPAHDDDAPAAGVGGGRGKFVSMLLQIMVLDIVFSLDSVITAVGMSNHIWIMVTAMIIAVTVMLIFANSISDFINRHPSMKVLALAFLILIGVMLVAEGMGQHVNKGYIYFAMAFSLAIEVLNMRLRKKSTAVTLHGKYETGSTTPPV
jgi:predicted tellurium resistance membrane protein TerC